MREHLEIVAQRQRHMLPVCGEVLVVKPAAVAAAVPVRVKGEAGHEHERGLIISHRRVGHGLRDVVSAGGDGGQIVQPQKPHLVAEDLRHSYALAVLLRLLQDLRGADLLVVGKIAVQALRGPVGRVREQKLCQPVAGRFDLGGGHGALFCADLRAEGLFVHMDTSRGKRRKCGF